MNGCFFKLKVNMKDLSLFKFFYISYIYINILLKFTKISLNFLSINFFRINSHIFQCFVVFVSISRFYSLSLYRGSCFRIGICHFCLLLQHRILKYTNIPCYFKAAWPTVKGVSFPDNTSNH